MKNKKNKYWILSAIPVLIIIFGVFIYIKDSTSSILGYYVYRESAPPNLERSCVIYVYEGDDGLDAQIRLDGTKLEGTPILKRYTAKVWTYGKKIKFEFSGYYTDKEGRKSVGLDDYIEGDTMLTLKKKGNKFMVKWAKLRPLLDQDDRHGEYFKKTNQNFIGKNNY